MYISKRASRASVALALEVQLWAALALRSQLSEGFGFEKEL
jgi:hypothetical protein